MKSFLILALTLQLGATAVFADEDPITTAETSAAKDAGSPKWDAAIQEK